MRPTAGSTTCSRLDGKGLVQNETFYNYHENWKHRAEATYLIFNAAQSAFNLTDPHHVATWRDGAVPPERWATDACSKEIEQLLFVERGINRRLRTAATGYGHAKLNLVRTKRATRPGRSLPELVRALKQFV